MISHQGTTMPTKKPKINKLALWLALFSFMTVACADDDVAFSHVTDVPLCGWLPSDTLLFEFHVVNSPTKGDYDKLLRNQYYGMMLNIRYTDDYQYSVIPLHVRFDNMRQVLVCPQPSRPATWGALMQEEFSVPDFYQAFADTGIHHIMIYPDTVLSGICSVGVELQRK